MRRITQLAIGVSLAAMVAACGGDAIDSQPANQAERGKTTVRGQTKADGTKSCVGFCGKKAVGCWCDSNCAKYGDCCPDKGDVCEGSKPKPPKKKPVKSCAGACGGQSPAGCWCDSNCAKYGDCCTDIKSVCGGSKPTPKPGKCAKDSDCNKSQFCLYKPGQCKLPTFNILEGSCKTIPESCYEIYKPVCGCDDKTYSNDCKAWAAGVSIAKQGPCAATPPPTGDKCAKHSDCAAGQLCKLKVGQCKLPSFNILEGSCEAIPENSYEIYKPVCGCDDKTYSNDCKAWAAGVNIAKDGACKKDPPAHGGAKCNFNSDCPQGLFCKLKFGECKLQTFNILEGVCTAQPEVCYQLYSPVCGCNGKTYSNSCGASAAGVNVASWGTCK